MLNCCVVQSEKILILRRLFTGQPACKTCSETMKSGGQEDDETRRIQVSSVWGFRTSLKTQLAGPAPKGLAAVATYLG